MKCLSDQEAGELAWAFQEGLKYPAVADQEYRYLGFDCDNGAMRDAFWAGWGCAVRSLGEANRP